MSAAQPTEYDYEAACERRLLDAAAVLADAAQHVWNIGDGRGGWVMLVIHEAFAEVGLSTSPEPTKGQRRSAISANVRAQVYARDGLSCNGCGSTERLTVDHIIPVARGGPDLIENLQTLCKSCNSSKRDR